MPLRTDSVEIPIKMAILFLLLSLFFFSGCVKVQRVESPIEEVSEAEMSKISQISEKKPSALKKESEGDPILRQFQKGIQLLEKGKTHEGRLVFETLRDLHPEVAVFHINLGIAYKRLNRMREAIAAYRQAIWLQGTYPEAYYNLAILFRDQGAFAEAEAAYLKTIALSPDFIDAHYNLAVLYDLYLDQAEAALRHYQRYTELKKETNEEMKIWMIGLEKRMTVESRLKKEGRHE